ncbi:MULTISPECIES: hypothetical protein [Acinetobacter]|uniref:Uncharacterized protein n=2 Tax=Acinetobacter TaxID=469 RepID=A0A4Q7AWY2_9GAMM|nr:MULTISPECIES: hypothetical protein [Acinetobacter]MCW8039292.1 hypothetical protein [Acinetobacter entericus]RZG66614.1 hypothetical protein EXE25_10185 [Acinetobacter bouvetii]TCB71469.1 hypothetical protein E0H91_16415 [Acinetobacter sp. ANC 4177]
MIVLKHLIIHYYFIKIRNLIGNLLKPELGKMKVEDAFAPTAIAGVDVNINKNCFGTASVSYAHLCTAAQ